MIWIEVGIVACALMRQRSALQYRELSRTLERALRKFSQAMQGSIAALNVPILRSLEDLFHGSSDCNAEYSYKYEFLSGGA